MVMCTYTYTLSHTGRSSQKLETSEVKIFNFSVLLQLLMLQINSSSTNTSLSWTVNLNGNAETNGLDILYTVYTALAQYYIHSTYLWIVLSIPNASFAPKQTNTLEGYLEAAIILQYNNH